MRENQGIRVLPLIRIPPRPQLLVPIQASCKTKTPTAKKLPPMIFPGDINQNKEKKYQTNQRDTPESVPPKHCFPTSVKPIVHEPLTPMTSNDLHHLLRNCLYRLSFKYINVFSIADIPKNAPNGDSSTRQVDNLLMIYSNNCSKEDKNQIAKYIMQSIVREPPKYELQNPFAETSAIFAISNSQQLEKLHFIFQRIIEDNPNVVSRKYLNSLFLMLDTNVDFERKEIEKELILLMSQNHNLRPYILNGLLSKLNIFQNPINNNNSNNNNAIISSKTSTLNSTLSSQQQSPAPYAIASILRVFVYYFNNILNGQPSKKAIFTFQTIFFPLYGNENYIQYEKPLKDITNFFLQRSPELALWAVIYITMHWPISSPRKEIAFLQTLGSVLQFADPCDLRSNVASKVSRILSGCIASSTINVSVSAMLCLSSNSILSFFDESEKWIFLADIVPALEVTAAGSWKQQVREMSSELLEHLKTVQQNSNIEGEINGNGNNFGQQRRGGRRAKKDREQIWTTIRTIARARRPVNSQKNVFHSS